MKIKFLFLILCLTLVGCSKPMINASVAEDIGFVSKSFATDTTQAFAAVRYALKISGYSIASDSQPEGLITSTWVPTKSDSHAVMVFDRRQMGVNGAYYQLEVHIVPDAGKVRIDVGAKAKSVVANLKSTGIEERKVLSEVGNYLRTSEPELSNIGLEE